MRLLVVTLKGLKNGVVSTGIGKYCTPCVHSSNSVSGLVTEMQNSLVKLWNHVRPLKAPSRCCMMLWRSAQRYGSSS